MIAIGITVFLTGIISAMLINNVVLKQFLGICPFLGVSKKIEASIGMSAAVAFVMILASIVSYGIHHLILVPFEIEFLGTIAFILVIASLVQFVEMFIKKTSKSLYKSLGIYLPLITTNCAILGVAQANVIYSYGFGEALAITIGSALGFGLIMFAFSAIRERLETGEVLKSFKGVPISLIVAAIMAMAFLGFGGMI